MMKAGNPASELTAVVKERGSQVDPQISSLTLGVSGRQCHFTERIFHLEGNLRSEFRFGTLELPEGSRRQE